MKALVILALGASVCVAAYSDCSTVAIAGQNAATGSVLAPASTRQLSSRSKIRSAVISVEPRVLDANGNQANVIISAKTGARTRVGIKYAARFQAYIDDLENNHGARVLFMTGIRPGRCSISSEHPCGKALDVCQLRRGVVDPRCRLPGRSALGQIAAFHGLFEGGQWCHSDYGHAQVGVTAPACGDGYTHVVRQ